MLKRAILISIAKLPNRMPHVVLSRQRKAQLVILTLYEAYNSVHDSSYKFSPDQRFRQIRVQIFLVAYSYCALLACGTAYRADTRASKEREMATNRVYQAQLPRSMKIICDYTISQSSDDPQLVRAIVSNVNHKK
jgi:hypothetical protein